MLATNKGSERKYLARERELRDLLRLLRCSYGGRMDTQTTKPKGGETTYHCYARNRRRQLRKMCECNQKSLSATGVEDTVWRFVSGLLRDAEKVRTGMKRLVERQLSERSGDPQREVEAWMERIAERGRLRSNYHGRRPLGS